MVWRPRYEDVGGNGIVVCGACVVVVNEVCDIPVTRGKSRKAPGGFQVFSSILFGFQSRASSGLSGSNGSYVARAWPFL